MTFKEAYESGKCFRRKGTPYWRSTEELKCCTIISVVDALADDWEIKPEPKVLKCWVNFYENGTSIRHDTKEEADKNLVSYYFDEGFMFRPSRSYKRVGEAVEVTKVMEE